MSEKKLLKDIIFNETSLNRLADLLVAAHVDFSRKDFVRGCLVSFPELELKQRISHIAVELEKVLSQDFETACAQIVRSLPEKLDPEKTDNDFGEFILSPFAEYIENNGCTKEYLDISLQTLQEISMRFSVEFSIRKFLNEFPGETFSFMRGLSQENNYHLRRLASEGLRPALPWAKKINIDYRKPVGILDVLFYDKTRYVTRSVANHMNDISKIDATFVLRKISEWKLSKKQSEKEMDYISRHSLRTLIKQGNKDALSMLGYKKPALVEIKNMRVSKQLAIGESLTFDFDIISHRKQKIMISYQFYFLNKKNELKPKLFQLKKINMSEGEKLPLHKKHLLKIMTTKKLYPGKHAIQLVINGLPIGDKKYFTLTK